MDRDFIAAIVGIAVVVFGFVFFVLWFNGEVEYDQGDIGTVVINDIEIEYKGSTCNNGLLKFYRAHIRTDDWDGITMKHWTVPVWCEE
jgi:hypothetical protein